MAWICHISFPTNSPVGFQWPGTCAGGAVIVVGVVVRSRSTGESWQSQRDTVCRRKKNMSHGTRIFGHLWWAIARGSDPGMSNRELSNDFSMIIDSF